jgi:hypothetical protein
MTGAAPSDQRRRLFLALAVGAVLAIGMIIKSVLFVDGEPVVINYGLTGLGVGLLGLMVLTMVPVPVERTMGVLCGMAVIWAALSAVMSGFPLNIVAAGSFALLVGGFGLILPVILWRSGVEAWRLVNILLTVGTVVTLLLAVVLPDLTIDPLSSRFRGAYVSVAVACTMFGFNALLSIKAALTAKSRVELAFWVAIVLTAAVLLYLTRTRSSLAECLVGVFILVAFAQMTRGVRLVVLAVIGLGVLFSVAALGAASTGVVAVDEQLEAFRLSDTNLTDARGGNWEFGIERIRARPLFGEGLLAKQTQGGTSALDLDAETNYDPRYDPHSLALSAGVQGGIPFLILMMAVFIYIPARFVAVFGVRAALASPEFVLVALRLSVSLLSGGDMTALGNIADKIVWLMLGMMALKIELKSGLWSQRRGAQAGPATTVPPRRPGRRLLPSG